MRRMLYQGLLGWMGLIVVVAESSRANSAPVVSNVIATQQTDGSRKVDIRYDLADADGDACTVSIQASSDGGATWTVSIAAVTGAVGAGVAPGTGKMIVWDCKVDRPGAAGLQYKVRVCADDGQGLPGMVLIPGGEFQMGDSFSEGHSDERPRHEVYVDAFYMDVKEVTNQQYADALNWAYAQGGLITVMSDVVYKYNTGTSYPYCDTTTSSSYSRITWNGSTFGVFSDKANHPMVMVSWYGSVAYANWRSGMQGRQPCYDLSTWTCDFAKSGYRLPTEAEWEKAARGGASGRRFPWSDADTIQHARANYYSDPAYSYDTSPTRGYHPTFAVGGSAYTSPVGCFAANGYGLYDVAGNVWEWCYDWHGYSYYSSSPNNNPRGPTSGIFRVLRGGSWVNYAYDLRCAYRNYDAPDYCCRYNGLRLALHSVGALRQARNCAVHGSREGGLESPRPVPVPIGPDAPADGRIYVAGPDGSGRPRADGPIRLSIERDQALGARPIRVWRRRSCVV